MPTLPAGLSMEAQQAPALLLGGFDGFSQRRHHFKKIADDSIIGHFKNRRVGVPVDGHNALRALHADEVLNGPRNAHGQVEPWGNRLPAAANLTFHGQPSVVADRS